MNDLQQYAHQASQLVPASYAEKAMASLMQLHSELMDEKERRVDLHRRLMEREQAIAELKMYVKLLEERQRPVAAPPPPAPAMMAPQPSNDAPPPSPPPLLRRPAPVPVQVGVRLRPEGWKVW